MKPVGYITVVLYAGMRGAEPQELGEVRLPFTLKSTASQTLEAHLSEAVEYVGESLRAVFANDEGEET